MTDEYQLKTYSLGMVYDPELGAWREPVTQKELELQRYYSECLKLSLRREGELSG